MVTGGYDSPLYWLFLALIVRGAVSVPRATSQIMLNLTLIACYVLAGLILIHVADYLEPTDREISFPGRRRTRRSRWCCAWCCCS